ncbi:ANTAR domain-containing response regulator [Clostridium gasigenes]|uniref:Stage 0 sporulation protein A homolog n=1 Tax=Clostridium gasigenes TaxID=94869 RepID=A0A1H0VB52_9CLOT|nr:response regulator [Clostridium gasigenes]MBB6624350.1 response regulator [Clostridium gasigenes]MBB6715836.1 response regulator [Clostridium gasigenes]MBU3088755.1 response regulator [Clostridium gasigenes]MBU3105644.1 response regulator [Clostridium gasigenes]MBU3109180.1 response regulator [Clostridium gasigenes]
MSKRIVIVDDEPITRMDLKSLLVDAGYDVVAEASDGFDAVEASKKYLPDIILMDINMPNLDGLKAAKIISRGGYAGGIILLTAFSDKEFIEKAKDVGVFAYLLKPLDEKSLIPTVEMVYSKSSEFKKLKKELDLSIKKIEERKIIERAKGMLMKEDNLTEEESYEKIRKLSMDRRCSMRSIGEAIVIAYEI